MAHVKQNGWHELSFDSESKRLGVKLYGGEKAKPGSVIIRQRGTKFHPGANVRRGKDDTLYAAKEGTVTFRDKRKICFNGKTKKVKVVSVE